MHTLYMTVSWWCAQAVVGTAGGVSAPAPRTSQGENSHRARQRPGAPNVCCCALRVCLCAVPCCCSYCCYERVMMCLWGSHHMLHLWGAPRICKQSPLCMLRPIPPLPRQCRHCCFQHFITRLGDFFYFYDYVTRLGSASSLRGHGNWLASGRTLCLQPTTLKTRWTS